MYQQKQPDFWEEVGAPLLQTLFFWLWLVFVGGWRLSRWLVQLLLMLLKNQ